jgi:ribulose-bisphosphate carboxylase small chain
MRLTQGTFSYLPDFTDEEIEAQVNYALSHDWPISIEYSDDPHPRNTYWEMWGVPLFEQRDTREIMSLLRSCREANPNCYVKLNAYDRSLGRQTTALSFIVHRPANEPGFFLDRQQASDRQLRYTLRPYCADKPKGERYQ